MRVLRTLHGRGAHVLRMCCGRAVDAGMLAHMGAIAAPCRAPICASRTLRRTLASNVDVFAQRPLSGVEAARDAPEPEELGLPELSAVLRGMQPLPSASRREKLRLGVPRSLSTSTSAWPSAPSRHDVMTPMRLP